MFSIIIITYNRPEVALELLYNLNDLGAIDPLLTEVIVLDNASMADYEAVKSFIEGPTSVPFHYIQSSENLGVSKGRNAAVRHAKAEYVFMIDDDAEFVELPCLHYVASCFQQSFEQRAVGAVSVQVRYWETGEIQRNLFPHKRFQERKDLDSFHTHYFAGAAHAIKRDVFLELGGFPADFFYGMEEYDLGYRLVKSGYCVVYCSRAVVLHKESPLGRVTPRSKHAMMWLNKVKVAWTYLPKRYYWSTVVMWSGAYFIQSKGDLFGWLKGLNRALAIRKHTSRQPLSQSDLTYLRRCEARLWY